VIIVAKSLAIDTNAYTTQLVVSKERAVFAAAATLADRQRAVGMRAPDAGLDAQRRAAYTRLADKPDLAIVTGIAGAGKSRLQRDVAAAYSEAGFRVIGTAVAGDAARTLGEEAAIDTRTVAPARGYEERSRSVRRPHGAHDRRGWNAGCSSSARVV
jgi:hypothetical protein